MGDISRHRDIFLFTRDGVSAQLLDGARLTPGDLTYLEMGNYLTDVSQFRDPVTYIFAKQRVWRDKVIPKTSDKLLAARVLLLAGAAAAYGVSKGLGELLSGDKEDYAQGAALAVGALAALAAILPSDTYADLAGADTWIDTLLGTPLDPKAPAGTAAQRAKRDEKHYGYLGEFFRLTIEGTTQFLFAENVSRRADSPWGTITPIPDNRVTEVYAEFFTQYFPHEHTDQPPYVWDASKRPSRPGLYGPSHRQGAVGVMSSVDVHYVAYLAEGLAKLEDDWRTLKRDDKAGRQRLLVRMGKLLHGVEDWFFHSNVVELLELRSYRPKETETTDEAILTGFVKHVATHREEYVAATDPAELRRLKRKLYRRLRFPAYDSGTKTQSAGRLSKTRMSTPSLRHAYPAFPSSQDTAHTLLHALENLEHKAAGEPGKLPTWITDVLNQRGLGALTPIGELAKPFLVARVENQLREWVPLVLTLLSEDERRRLVANVAPEHWPLSPGAPHPPRTVEETETDLQAKRHAKALEPHTTNGRTESNYEEFVRLLFERGHLNARGQQALVAAFAIDRKSEQLPTDAPGCGGFLMQFAVELQEQLDAGDAATAELNKTDKSIERRESDNDAFNEIVGSHSLMSKDTTLSVPFFDDARVLASVASSSVFTIMLQQVATPVADRRLAWEEVLHHLIRFPPTSGGWERQALAKFAPKKQIPGFSDLPELAAVAARYMRPVTPPAAKPRKAKRDELEELYQRLEGELSKYRYP